MLGLRPRLRAGVGFGALVALYPLAVYWGLGHWSPRWLAVGLLVLLLLRIGLGAVLPGQRWVLAAAAALALIAMAGDVSLPLKLYPVAVNAALLGVFALSLWRPPTVIERIARLSDPALPAEGVAYTRRVTQAWCVFFTVNGALALATALLGSDEVWMLYNGLLAYGLIGLMFAGEWLLRGRARRRWAAHG